MKPDWSNPRHLVLAALEMAGFPVEQLGDDFIEAPAQEEFLLEFDVQDGASLSLAFDCQTQMFLAVIELPHSPMAWQHTLALQLNQVIEPHLRIQLCLERDRLQLHASLAAEHAQVDDLAMALLDLAHLQGQIGQASPPPTPLSSLPFEMTGIRV